MPLKIYHLHLTKFIVLYICPQHFQYGSTWWVCIHYLIISVGSWIWTRQSWFVNSLKRYIEGEEMLHNKKKLVAAIMTFWEEASWYIIALVTGKGNKMDCPRLWSTLRKCYSTRQIYWKTWNKHVLIKVYDIVNLSIFFLFSFSDTKIIKIKSTLLEKFRE